jgi:hypothetical protein
VKLTRQPGKDMFHHETDVMAVGTRMKKLGMASTFRAPNMKIYHSLTIPSGILNFPLVAPAGVILCHITKAKVINHIGTPSIERALS